jgi:hypothetical protein
MYPISRAALEFTTYLLLVTSQTAWAGAVELIRGGTNKLCVKLAEELAAVTAPADLLCGMPHGAIGRTMASPSWKPLDPSADRELIFAADRYRFSIDPKSSADVERYERNLAPRIAAAVESGRASLFETRANVVTRGPAVRLIRFSLGCDKGGAPAGHDYLTVVFSSDSDMPDDRFQSLPGDIVTVSGIPYLLSTSEYPSAIGREAAPPKRHDGYVLLYQVVWSPPGSVPALGHSRGYAHVLGPYCQIGIDR